MASSLDSDSEGSRDATEDSRDKGVHGHVLLFVGERSSLARDAARVNRLTTHVLGSLGFHLTLWACSSVSHSTSYSLSAKYWSRCSTFSIQPSKPTWSSQVRM